MFIDRVKVVSPAVDGRLFEHGTVPQPACISREECVGAYVVALKAWGERLAGQLDAVKEALK